VRVKEREVKLLKASGIVALLIIIGEGRALALK